MPGKEERRHLKTWFRKFAAILLGLGLGLPACGERNVYLPPPPAEVRVSRPERRQILDYLEFTGNTQAYNTVKLRARVEGYLEQVFFQDGEVVKKGQPLFLIQQNTYRAKLQQAEAEVLAQKARLEHARTEFARFSKLLQQKAAAQTDVDRWRYERDAAQAALLAAEANRELARLNLSYTLVTAPFTGRIDRRLQDVGNLVGAGEQTVLAEINQIDPIYVYFTINERDLLRVLQENRETLTNDRQEKWPVLMALAHDHGYPHQGYIDFAAISVDPNTGTLLLRGIFPNQDGVILPGLFARLRAPASRKPRPALLVPQEAVATDQQGTYVLVVDQDHRVERRSVRLGPVVDGCQVIDGGLQGEEQVVIQGLLRAIPGRQVKPLPWTEPNPAPATHP